MSDIMTDMKTKTAPKKKSVKRRAAPVVRDTFTVRDLNRQPQVVLTAARKLGRITIRCRAGGNFVLEPEHQPAARLQSAQDFLEGLEAIHKRFRNAGFVGLSKIDSEKLSRVIAGEDP